MKKLWNNYKKHHELLKNRKKNYEKKKLSADF